MPHRSPLPFAFAFAWTLGALTFGGGCARPAPSTAAAPLTGPLPSPSLLPSVALRSLENVPASIEAVRQGRPALVVFWAPWCEACLTEIAALNRLHARITGPYGIVMGVAVGEPAAKIKDFVSARGLQYPQLVDEEFQLTSALAQNRLPKTLVVDHRGAVVFSGGLLNKEALAAFRKVLNEPQGELPP